MENCKSLKANTASSHEVYKKSNALILVRKKKNDVENCESFKTYLASSREVYKKIGTSVLSILLFRGFSNMDSYF